MRNIKPSSQRSFFKSKGFITALSVCLVAVGAAAFVALNDTAPSIGQTLTGDASTSPSSRVPSYQAPASSAPSVQAPSAPSTTPSKPQETAPPVENNGSTAVDVVTPSASFFVMPITGEIVKGFSDSELQYSMTYSDWRLHTAVDIAGKIGDTVNAAGDGVVISVAKSAALGNTVEINHGNGIVVSYCGLDSVTVKAGDSVKANEKIGTLGEIPCECVEAVHLHLSATKENKPVDPLNIMGLDK